MKILTQGPQQKRKKEKKEKEKIKLPHVRSEGSYTAFLERGQFLKEGSKTLTVLVREVTENLHLTSIQLVIVASNISY